MSVLAAIAGFPVLTLVLIGLFKAENGLYDRGSVIDEPVVEPAVVGEPAVD